MEGMERLLLTEDGLNIDPVLFETSSQLHHHETAQALLANSSSVGHWARHHRHWYSLSYIWPIAALTARFANFFNTLYCSMLFTLLFKYIWLKILFLLFNSLLHLLIPPPFLISFTLASFSHSELLWEHFSNASDHLQLHVICITSFMQDPSLRILFLNIITVSSLSFHHFILDTLTRLLHWKWKSITTSLYWGNTHSRYHLTI
jgi:hypothetical protein